MWAPQGRRGRGGEAEEGSQVWERHRRGRSGGGRSGGKAEEGRQIWGMQIRGLQRRGGRSGGKQA